jgi:hypothetical protein
VGTTVNICYECVDLCNGMIAEERVWREALRHLDLGRVLHKQESCLSCSFASSARPREAVNPRRTRSPPAAVFGVAGPPRS